MDPESPLHELDECDEDDFIPMDPVPEMNVKKRPRFGERVPNPASPSQQPQEPKKQKAEAEPKDKPENPRNKCKICGKSLNVQDYRFLTVLTIRPWPCVDCQAKGYKPRQVTTPAKRYY